jgi:hypothetical protein
MAGFEREEANPERKMTRAQHHNDQHLATPRYRHTPNLRESSVWGRIISSSLCGEVKGQGVEHLEKGSWETQKVIVLIASERRQVV